MAQQIADSKFSGHGLPNNETGLANQDKQPTLLVTAKKIPLRDLQNEIRITGPTSMESSLFRKESGLLIEASKSCGTKRPAPECLVSPPHLQSPTTNAANGHLVYVRRRPDLELAKSSISYNTSNITDIPQGERKLHGCDETTEQKSDVKEPKVCVQDVAPLSRASLMCFSSGGLSVSPSDSNHLSFSPVIPPLDCPQQMLVSTGKNDISICRTC